MRMADQNGIALGNVLCMQITSFLTFCNVQSHRYRKTQKTSPPGDSSNCLYQKKEGQKTCRCFFVFYVPSTQVSWGEVDMSWNTVGAHSILLTQGSLSHWHASDFLITFQAQFKRDL